MRCNLGETIGDCPSVPRLDQKAGYTILDESLRSLPANSNGRQSACHSFQIGDPKCFPVRRKDKHIALEKSLEHRFVRQSAEKAGAITQSQGPYACGERVSLCAITDNRVFPIR